MGMTAPRSSRGLRASMAIGRVRIHDEVLSESQILSNYEEERGAFFDPQPPEPPTPEPVPVGPVHRYSFDNSASGDATGETIVDSAGGQDGIVVGDGSSFTGTALRLDGGDMNVAAYVDLPNGLISKLTDATVEGWVTIEGVQNWQRVFDFGSTTGGELEEPGGGGAGQDAWMLSAARGTNISTQRYSVLNQDPEFGGDEEGPVGVGEQMLDTSIPTQLEEEYHFAAVYDSDGAADGGAAIKLYRDGELMGTQPVTIALGNMNDVNNWLGRSNWTADANTQGSYNEIRIYDFALTNNQVLGSFENGPETINLGLLGDYNNNGELDAGDLDLQAQAIAGGQNPPEFDLNGDGVVDVDGDRIMWLHDLKKVYVGDVDLDGFFESGDFVAVFVAGKYETSEAATWEEGDWNADLVFSSADFVTAFIDGGYEMGQFPGAVQAVPEPSGLLLLLGGILAVCGTLRRRLA